MTHRRERTALSEMLLARIDAMPLAGEHSVRFAFACTMERYVAFSRKYEASWQNLPDLIQNVIGAWMAAWWSAVPEGSIDAAGWKPKLEGLEMTAEMPVGPLMVWTRSVQALGSRTSLRDDLADLTLDLCNGTAGSLTHRLPAARRDLWYMGMTADAREAEMLNVWGGHPASLLVLDQLQADLDSSLEALDVAPNRARSQGRELAILTSRLDSIHLPEHGSLDDPFWD